MREDVRTIERKVRRLRTEVDCRIGHGAEGHAHLCYVRAELDDILRAALSTQEQPPHVVERDGQFFARPNGPGSDVGPFSTSEQAREWLRGDGGSTQEQGEEDEAVRELESIIAQMEAPGERRPDGFHGVFKGMVETWADRLRHEVLSRLATDLPRDEPDGERVFECSFCHQRIQGKTGHSSECPGFRTDSEGREPVAVAWEWQGSSGYALGYIGPTEDREAGEEAVQRKYDAARDKIASLKRQLGYVLAEAGGKDGAHEKYHELLYAVASKFPGETRHETALRYIRQAERGSDVPMKNPTPPSPEGDEADG